jgi:hypothetical protein
MTQCRSNIWIDLNRECTPISKRRLPQVCGRQRPSVTETAAEFLEVAAVIVQDGYDRLSERTTLVPRPCHPDQISKREVVTPQAVYRTDQAKTPVAVAQLTSVPLPAAVEELLEADQVLISAADLFG